MKQKTALQEFLEQIVLKQVKGSVYLLPAVTDIQIEEALKKEREQHGNTWDAAIKAHDDRGHVHARSLTDFDDYEVA